MLACAPHAEDPSSFTISIATSRTIDQVPYGGSYQFERDGDLITRDLSGTGSRVEDFSADRLIFVRIHAASGEGLHSLTIQRGNKTLYESQAQPTDQPLLYHAPR